VVILSVHLEADFVSQALQAGASGYLPKDATPMELAFALRAVVSGETYLSPRVSGDLVDRFVRSAGAGKNPLQLLTPRQREILQLIAEGHSTKQIASRLNLSVKTVESHRALLMERLGIHDTAGRALFAARVGLVEPDK
jgi:DNA-binding NarL/FixJ family response regulator